MNNPKRRFSLPALAGVLLACMLASCSALVGPRQVELPLAKLQAGIDRRFPMSNRVLELFEVALTRPQLALLPDSGRVALTMDASVSPPFVRQSWRGSLVVSGRLYVDAGRNAVLMAEPRVDRFAIDGVDPASGRQLSGIANSLMNKIASDMVVYSFRPEDLRYAGVQFVPTRIVTNADALLVSVEPR